MAAGSIVVDLLMRTGSFETDTKRAEQSLKRLKGEFSSLVSTFGIGLSVAGFVSLIKSSIDAADHMNDLSKTTGLAVEQIAGLSLASKQSGADLDSVTASIDKLSKNIGTTPDAFKKLGISAKDPLEAFKQLADVFNGINDPQLRAAVAAKALGKSWETTAPLLSEGSKKIQEMIDKGTALSGITKESAERADEFNDRIEELKTGLSGLVTKGIGPLLPLLIEAAKYFGESGNQAKEAAGGFNLLLETFKPLIVLAANVGYVFKQTGVEIGGMAAQLNLLAHGDFKGISFLHDAMKKDADAARKELDAFEQRILNPSATKPTTPSGKPIGSGALNAAGRNFVGNGSGGADNDSKKLLDNTLKTLENAIDREKDLLASRNKFIELYNSENLLSINDYYGAKDNAQQDNLSKTLALYDKEIAAAQKAQGQASKKSDKAEIQGKINDLLAKEQKLNDDITQQTIVDSVEKQKALRDYQDSIAGVNASILELQGNLGAAAAIRFDIQNRGLTQRFSAEGNQEAQKSLEIQRAYTIAQADANALDQKSAMILDGLANQEARITLSQKLGSMSEISALTATDNARGKSVYALRALVDEYERVAHASGNPKLLQDADNLKLKFEELEASSHQLADTFNKIFEDSASNAFGDFIDGSKSASEAFRSFADDVVKQINRIVAQQLAQQLFGDMSSGGGGLGGIFAGIFGGSSGSTEAFAGAGAGSGEAGGFGSWLSSLMSFDVGTDYVPQDMIAQIHRGERIVPAAQNNGSWKSAPNITMNVTTPDANSFRTSQGEFLGSLSRKLSMAQRNN